MVKPEFDRRYAEIEADYRAAMAHLWAELEAVRDMDEADQLALRAAHRPLVEPIRREFKRRRAELWAEYEEAQHTGKDLLEATKVT